MLQSIHIQNFRCFEDFKAEGFERVNLIGGKNNSGKSCLLEGIYCGMNENPLSELITLRDENYQNTLNEDQDGKNFSITVSGKLSWLGIENIEVKHKYTISPNGYSLNRSNLDFVFSNNIYNISLITQTKQIPEISLVKAFDEFAINKLKASILSVVQIIDSNIEDITSYSSKGDKLYISKKGEKYKPISSFGDATKNLIRYFTPFFQKKVANSKYLSLLLIDEIENGIHYTAHKEFWQHLFKLCKELNVQVFATTHSLEMIKAFNEVALQEGEAGYFEMVKEPETNNIKIAKHRSKLLQYELNQDEQIRGEY